MMFFDCSPQVMLQRVLNRGKTSQRIDDNEESFWKRWNGYLDTTMPVLELFRGRNQVVTVCSTITWDGLRRCNIESLF